jgi:hypothetical protein
LYSSKGKQDDKIQKYHRKGEGKMSIRERFEKAMMAATFAEAGEHDTALEIMGEEKRVRKQDRKTVRPKARLQMRAPSARG